MRIISGARDFSGTLRVLDHCEFGWRQRAPGAMRVVTVETLHCGTCLGLIERFGPWDGLVTVEQEADCVSPWRYDATMLRTLKDRAALAVERRRHRHAAELFLEIAHHEPNEPTWPLRAAESLRISGQEEEAAEQMATAAAAYAWAGSFHKALAACKVALLLDPRDRGGRALSALLSRALLVPARPAILDGAAAR